jgi:inorganic pyrophosphatase
MLAPFPHKRLVRVVVETPRGSRHKYEFLPEHDAFRLNKTLPEGMTFPHDFGFVPQTQGEDGDPLDALVLFSEPTFPGCIVDCRLIGVIRASQKAAGEAWIRNDRYLTIAEANARFAHVTEVRALPASVVEELQRFFENYNELEGRRFRVHRVDGPGPARRLLRASHLFSDPNAEAGASRRGAG